MWTVLFRNLSNGVMWGQNKKYECCRNFLLKRRKCLPFYFRTRKWALPLARRRKIGTRPISILTRTSGTWVRSHSTRETSEPSKPSELVTSVNLDKTCEPIETNETNEPRVNSELSEASETIETSESGETSEQVIIEMILIVAMILIVVIQSALRIVIDWPWDESTILLLDPWWGMVTCWALVRANDKIWKNCNHVVIIFSFGGLSKMFIGKVDRLIWGQKKLQFELASFLQFKIFHSDHWGFSLF